MAESNFTRRSALRTIGAGIAGTAALSGTGSAHCVEVSDSRTSYRPAANTPLFTPRWEFDTFTINDAIDGWSSSRTQSLPEWSQQSGIEFTQSGDSVFDRATLQLDKRYSNIWGSVSQLSVVGAPVHIDLDELSVGEATLSVDIDASYAGAVELSGSPSDSTQIDIRGAVGFGPYTDVRQQTKAPGLSSSFVSARGVERSLFDKRISGSNQRRLIEQSPSMMTLTTEVTQSDTYVVYGVLESVADIEYENDAAKVDFSSNGPDMRGSGFVDLDVPHGLSLEQIRIRANELR
ncbi:hypothetical protein [Halocatena halophila]|uniref:hypothetical protein n=1 Tax=Halocatena halophila TaxID=2814576 RepID=UPI002ED3179A